MYKRFENIFLAGFAVVALGLGFWGFALAGSDYAAGIGGHPVHPLTWLEGLRCLLASIGLIRLVDLFQPVRDPWQLVVAQFAVPGVALLSAAQLFLIGVRRNIRTALARHKSGHTVVCGVGDVGMQVVESLRDAGQDVVAIDLSDESPNAATCEKSGVPVLKGDAKNQQVLLAAGLRHARTAVITTGADSENLEIALQIRTIRDAQAGSGGGGIKVLTEMRSGWMQKRLLASETSSLSSKGADLRFFNPHSNAARMLLRRLRIPPAPEFEARTFVLAGFGAHGREIARHLIRCSPVSLGYTLNLLIFDADAEAAKDQFEIAEPAAAAIASLEFVQASLAPGSPDWKTVVEGKLKGADRLLGVALAVGNDDTSLCAALEMRLLLDRTRHFDTPVFVRLEHYRQLGELVLGAESMAGFCDRLEIFGTLEQTLSADVLLSERLDALAQALHQDYRRRPGSQVNPKANVAWDALPESFKMSNRWRADHTPLLMELAGLHLVVDVKSPAGLPPDEADTLTLAQLEHRRYTIERRMNHGGPGEDRAASLADWTHLSPGQQSANRQETARVPQILAGLGIEVLPVRTVRLYGERLRAAAEEMEPIVAAPQFVHCNLIVDLDDAEAVRFSARALDLPSLSVWLFSRETPPELLAGTAEAAPGPRTTLIERAAGWAPRARVNLQAASDAATDNAHSEQAGGQTSGSVPAEVGPANQAV